MIHERSWMLEYYLIPCPWWSSDLVLNLKRLYLFYYAKITLIFISFRNIRPNFIRSIRKKKKKLKKSTGVLSFTKNNIPIVKIL